MTCIAGFSSVMIDLASSDFQKNVHLDQKWCRPPMLVMSRLKQNSGKFLTASLRLHSAISGLTDPELAAKFSVKQG